MSRIILPGHTEPPATVPLEVTADKVRESVERSGALAMVLILHIRNGRPAFTVSGPRGITPLGRAAFARIAREAADAIDSAPKPAPSPHDWETI